MANVSEYASRGVVFVRNNPQIVYTFFLLIAIPVAFFFTSNKFLSVAQENQDRLEQSRVALLQDIVAAFAQDYVGFENILETRIQEIAAQNETIARFLVLTPVADGQYAVVASGEDAQGGEFVADAEQDFLIRQSLVRPSETHLMQRFRDGERFWDAARAIPSTLSSQPLYIYTQISMANVDAIAVRNITNAYIVLFVIIILIFLLLMRQAKIIDYAALYRKLKEVDVMKDDFVSMAAHELRSPLTIIRGYVDMLKGESLAPRVLTTLENIDRSASQLNVLVADILDVSKLQEGRMSFVPKRLDVSPLLLEVAASFQKTAEDKGLDLTIKATDTLNIIVDPDRMRQVLINLIGNAVKYTAAGSVTVTTERVGSWAEIRISDTGFGISAEAQAKLFEKFYRVRTEETKLITGTGLGLWITKEIVRQMNGVISVESIKGKGSDFILRFPMSA